MEDATTATRQCSKCTGEMEAGFLLDRSQTWVFPTVWADSLAKRNWLGGLKESDTRIYRVETWRCKDCGHLESYAKNRAGLYDR